MADNLFATTLAETEDLVEELEGEGKESRTEELLRRVLEENRAANADLIRQVTGQRHAQPGQPLQQDDPLAGMEFGIDDLPNPQIDPAAFHKAYLERATKALRGVAQNLEQRTTSQMQRALSDREVYEKAEAMIKAVEPDANQEVIGMASRVVAERLRGQGKDPMAELRGNMEGVAQDVVDYIDEMRGSLGGSRRQQPERDTGRARGLVSGRNKAPAAPKQQPKAHDPLELVRDLQKLQRDHRIY